MKNLLSVLTILILAVMSACKSSYDNSSGMAAYLVNNQVYNVCTTTLLSGGITGTSQLLTFISNPSAGSGSDDGFISFAVGTLSAASTMELDSTTTNLSTLNTSMVGNFFSGLDCAAMFGNPVSAYVTTTAATPTRYVWKFCTDSSCATQLTGTYLFVFLSGVSSVPGDISVKIQ